MKIESLIIISLILASVMSSSASQQSIQVRALQKSIKQSAKMDFSNYKFYPFAISHAHQFVLVYRDREEVRGEIILNWIDEEHNSLSFPAFNENQYVKMTIFDVTINKTIQERKFHFQTGFKFIAQPGHRYNMIFKDFGIKNKMVELLISRVQSPKLTQFACTNTTDRIIQILSQTKSIYKELSDLASAKQQSETSSMYDFINKNLTKYFYFSIWEICLVCCMMGCQMYLFNRFVKSKLEFI